MGVGFCITGNVEKVDTLVKTARRMVKKSGYTIEVSEGSMWISLCPMGELVFRWKEDEEKPGWWRVEMDCVTSQVQTIFPQQTGSGDQQDDFEGFGEGLSVGS